MFVIVMPPRMLLSSVLFLLVAAWSVRADTNAPGSAVWTGKGDGKNWSDVRNWQPNIVPTNTATIGEPEEPRVIVVDKAARADTLTFDATGNNTLKLGDDLTVRLLDLDMGADYKRAHLDLGGHTLTISESTRSYLPNLHGKGLFVKAGPGTCYAPNNSKDYSGDYEVRSGILVYWGGNMGAGGSTNLTVHDGAAVTVMNPSPMAVVFPTNVVIHGVGEGDGVLTFVYQDFDFCSDLTVASDAKVSNRINVTWYGSIKGPGTLTLGAVPGKVNALAGTLECALRGAYANRIIAAGMMDIGRCTLAVTGGDTAAAREYPLIDFSSTNAVVTGQFAATNAPKRWFVEYAGTDTHPDCVVLVNPPLPDSAVTIP